MRTYTIRKNCHYSRFPFPIPHVGIKSYGAVAIFWDNCWYPLDTNKEQGLNKLCGFTYGSVHKNSFRIGWQPDFLKPGTINLYYYQYINGKRKNGYLCSINTGVAFDILIHVGYNYVAYGIDDNIPAKIVFKDTISKKWGVGCFPYFGGNSKAPHKMKIELDYLFNY